MDLLASFVYTHQDGIVFYIAYMTLKGVLKVISKSDNAVFRVHIFPTCLGPVIDDIVRLYCIGLTV